MKARLVQRNLTVAAISSGLVGVMTVAAIAAWTTAASGAGATAAGSLSAPGTPSASGITASSVNLSWTAGTAGTATVKYHVERAAFGGSTWTDVCSSTDAGPIPGLTCTDSTVAGSTDYQYRVTSEVGKWRNTGGTSAKATTPSAGATKLVFTTSPSSSTGGTAFATQPVVKVEDASNTVVTSSTASVTLAIGTNAGPGGNLSCTANPISAVAGVATFAGCKIDKAGVGYTLTASASGLASDTSGAVTISVGSASKLVFTNQPSSSNTAATSFGAQPMISVTDAGGNVITGSSASIALAIGTNAGPGGALTCTTNPLAATSGVATFAGCKIDKAGTGYTLTAASGVLTGATSNSFDVTAGSATKLVVTTSPSSSTGGTAFATQPVVKVEDAGGNVIIGSSAPITLAIGTNAGPGGTLTCTTNPLNAISGSANFAGCKIDKAGSGYTLTASSSGLTGDTSSAFNVTVGTPSKLAFTTSPSNANGGTAFGTQPVVKVQDAGSNVVTSSSAPITLAIGTNAGPGGALTCTTNPLNASSGVATFAGCKVDRAGNGYTLTASSSGLTSDTSVAFNINVGAASQLVFTTQPGGSTATATAFGTQPVVKVADAGGNVVAGSGASITLAIGTNPGGSGTALSCTTNPLAASSGVASFAGCKINNSGSGYTLNATSSGLTTATSSPFDVGLFPTSVTITNGTGSAGRPDQGDKIAIVFDQAVSTTTVCTNWTGVAAVTGLTVVVGNGNGSHKNDLSFGQGSSACNSLNIGTMAATGSNYNTSSGDASFTNSTMTWNSGSSTLTITMGASNGSGTPAQDNTNQKYTYTPSASITTPGGTAAGDVVATASAIQF